MDRPAPNILLTGPPGIGKTTCIRALASECRRFRPVGFFTQEIGEKGARVGFSLNGLDGKTSVLAHTAIQSPFRVGRYGVDIEGFERFIEGIPFRDPATSLVIIDEIGKMECLSPQFRELIGGVLDSPAPCVATIAKRGDRFIEALKERDDVVLCTISRENRDQLASELVRAVSLRMR